MRRACGVTRAAPSPTARTCRCCPILEIFRSYFGIGQQRRRPQRPARRSRDACRSSTRTSATCCPCCSTFSAFPIPKRPHRASTRPGSAPAPALRDVTAQRLGSGGSATGDGRPGPDRGPALDRRGERGVARATGSTRRRARGACCSLNFRPEYRAEWMERSSLPADPAGCRSAPRRSSELLDRPARGDDPSTCEASADAIHAHRRQSRSSPRRSCSSLIESGQLEGARGGVPAGHAQSSELDVPGDGAGGAGSAHRPAPRAREARAPGSRP